MSRDEHLEELREKLWLLSPTERAAMLVCTCVEHDPSALGSAVAITGALFVLGKRLRVDQRVVLAEKLRETATRLEQQQRFPCPKIETRVIQFARRQV